MINLHVREQDMVIVGNGCAGAEGIKALRESGYKEKIHLFTDGRWPVDASGLGIKQDDAIRISTPKDKIVVRANLTQMVQPGVIHMYHGHSEADVNVLFESDYLDPLSGFPGFKSGLCNVEKV